MASPIAGGQPMRMLNAAQTAARLPYPQLVDALRAMLLKKRNGTATSPDRLAVPLPGGVLLVMPATDETYVVIKLATLHFDNPARGLPNLQGEVILMRAGTGERVIMLDAPTVTARRTAAISVLAAITLRPPRPGPMLFVGAGVQAHAHLEAFAATLGIESCGVLSRSTKSAQRFVADAAAIGVAARPVDDLPKAVSEASIIITVTPSTQPVIPDQVRDDALVIAVGAFSPGMCELPASLVRRSALYVDDMASARLEAGDFLQAGIDWKAVIALEDMLANAPTPGAVLTGDGPSSPANRRPIVFKSLGHALWDLAAARMVADQAA